MPRLPSLSGRDLVRALKRAGFEEVRQRGSHVALCKRTPKRTYKVIVPLHSSLARGTLFDILKQAGLTPEELRSLL
jgi:predicted RNA binding protein YcfA (HicA-like mRNA interferase family)